MPVMGVTVIMGGAFTTAVFVGTPLILRCVRIVAMMLNVNLLKRGVTILESGAGVVCETHDIALLIGSKPISK